MSDPEFTWFYASSEDAEIFTHASSREDAIAQAEEEKLASFFITEACPFRLHDDIFDADQVLERFEDHNEEAWGEDGPNGKVAAVPGSQVTAVDIGAR